jgi:uncharacterized membrane protein (DUF373 family)
VGVKEPTGHEGDDELRGVDKALHLGEDVIYAAAGLVLLVGAIAVLASTGYHLVSDLSHGVADAVGEALDGLLLVFILLELLAATRAIMAEHSLVAEPFLIVGIIASIKEIVVLALIAQDELGKSGDAFENAMVEIGALGVIILMLSIAMYLVRRKEREPEEERDDAGADPGPERGDAGREKTGAGAGAEQEDQDRPDRGPAIVGR